MLSCFCCLFTSKKPPVSQARFDLYNNFIESNHHWDFCNEEKQVIFDVFTSPTTTVVLLSEQVTADTLDRLLSNYEEQLKASSENRNPILAETNKNAIDSTLIFCIADIYDHAIVLLNTRLKKLYHNSKDSSLIHKDAKRIDHRTIYHCIFPQHKHLVLEHRYCKTTILKSETEKYGVIRNLTNEKTQYNGNKYCVFAEKNVNGAWEIKNEAHFFPASKIPAPQAPHPLTTPVNHGKQQSAV